jgi:hypothetical protein
VNNHISEMCPAINSVRTSDLRNPVIFDSTVQNKIAVDGRIRPPLWSSGQSSWLQIRRPGFDYRQYQKKSSGSGTGSTQPREYN